MRSKQQRWRLWLACPAACLRKHQIYWCKAGAIPQSQMRMFTVNRQWKPARFVQHACATLCATLIFGSLVWGQLDLDRMRDLALQRYGQSTANLVDEWHTTIQSMRSMPEEQRLIAANNFFNR